MDPVIDSMFCKYCRHFGPKKYHNTNVPYCELCNTDTYGHIVYKCDSCGLLEPDNRMETEQTCKNCWKQLTAA